MGTHVHQVNLGVDPPSVGELEWRWIVGCHDELSPTEVVQLDVSRLTILGVLHCYQGLNASVGLSL